MAVDSINRKINHLKNFLLAVLLVLSGSCTVFSQNKDKPKWTLSWREEFNYNGLPDTTIWSYDVGGTGWGNDELQYYTQQRKQNAHVSNGHLYIQAIKENYKGKAYTSARLVTKGKKDFRYGKIEVRARPPKGRGIWPAIWMLSSKVPRTWPDDGEIDIMEYVGYARGEITGAAHVKKNETGNDILSSVNEIMIDNVEEKFYIYTLTWTPTRLEWWVDNKMFHFYEKGTRPGWQWPFDVKFHIILNIAVGGSWGGRRGIDDSIFPQTFAIDYIRAYNRIN
jgi:beta-glucanase (GH16 family)